MKMKFPFLCASIGLSMVLGIVAHADDASVAANSGEKSYTGTLTAIDAQAHTLSARGMLLGKQFHLGDNCTFVLPNNAVGGASNLRAGEKVQISYQNVQGVLAADRVEIVPMQYDGTVQAIDPVNHTLTIWENRSNRNLALASGCRVVLQNSQAGTLNNIQIGDRVTVRYETPGDQATAWQITRTSESIIGSLMAVDLTDRTVKVKAGFTTKQFTLADNCAIVLNGQTQGRLQDLQANERVVLTYNQANGVNVVNRIAPAPVMSTNPSITSGPGAGY